MKVGDKVKISDKNPNHLGFGVSAYANVEGVVGKIWDDGGFTVETATSVLVVPFGKRKGCWVYVNDKLVYHKRKRKFNLKIK